MAQRFNSALWECRIVANTSAFQAEDAGSIPVIPSTSRPSFRWAIFRFLSPALLICGLRVKMCVWLGVSLGLDLAFLDAD